MNKSEYQLYLQTEDWKRTRWWKLASINWTCERCGFTAWTDLARKYLHVHHLSYERLGHERLDDLEALCMHCHEYEHGHRAEPGQGTDPDIIPYWMDSRERIAMIFFGEFLPYCRAECSGCDRRLYRCEIEIPMTVAWAGWLILNREPDTLLGGCIFCGCAVYNCRCGDCKLQWALDGGGDSDGRQETRRDAEGDPYRHGETEAETRGTD